MGVESLVHSESPADAASALNGLSESLPPLGLLGLALVGPYFLVLAVYGYHYGFRRTASKLRSDEPKEEHIWGWKRALFRPEGISAVVGYMAIGITIQLVTGINIIPPCIKVCPMMLSFCSRIVEDSESLLSAEVQRLTDVGQPISCEGSCTRSTPFECGCPFPRL
jgi:hypothetical protein